ncbi:MAG: hypothetical protein ABFR97_10260 [Thermodesulfobacteriota bacterium]
MNDPLAIKIEKQLLQGKKKKTIWEEEKSGETAPRALFLLNNSAELAERKRFQLINLSLAIILAFVTFKKLLTAFSFGRLDVFFFTSLVVPIINIYILKEILRFKRLGFQYLFILSALSLVLPQNRSQPLELFLTGGMIILSAFLYLKLFPKGKQISPPQV